MKTKKPSKKKTIKITFHMGQQVKILPVKKEYRWPVECYKPSIAIIVGVSSNNPYEYSICPRSKKDVNSGAWFPHNCMKLMLRGKVTQVNFKRALKYFYSE